MTVKELLENKPRLHELPERYDQLFEALKEAVETLEKISQFIDCSGLNCYECCMDTPHQPSGEAKLAMEFLSKNLEVK